MNPRFKAMPGVMACAVLCALAAFGTTLTLPLTGVALAANPQTISIDGSNDFLPANNIENDTGDTETTNFCADDPEDDTPMDLGNIYVTNDANNLYIGFEYDRECFSFPQVNLGIAFSYGLEGDGGTTDPFNRKIAWNTITRKPDNVFYVVIDGFNFEAFYQWNGAGWDNIAGTINPGYGSGSNGLGMANDTGFEELSLPLSAFGAGLGENDDLFLEIWMTQDGTTKPPLDCAFSDGVQTSTLAGTTFDTTGPPIEMTTWFQYTICPAPDLDPPLVTGASHDVDSEVTVTFNEPVDQTTAGIPGNYALAGGTTPATVIAATRDLVAHNVVHLTLSNDILASADAYSVTVTGVNDEAAPPNTIVNDGVGNVACFGVKEVTFEGFMGPFLATNSDPPDGFTVEGSKAPLTFALCDGADMVDVGNDTWQFTTDFSFPVNCGNDSGSLFVEWKFAHNCTLYEDQIGNRSFTLDIASPSQQTISAFWNDLDPTAFTDKEIDVVFTVNMFRQAPGGGDVVSIGGNRAPLTFAGPPWTDLVDDGSGDDAVGGDQIYTTRVRFPVGTQKGLSFKYLLNDVFECSQTGDRTLFLNDAIFSTTTPLVMPLAYYDRCFVVGRDVEVVFSVDTNNSSQTTHPFDPVTVQLTGNRAPLDFDLQKVAPTMKDDGVLPDVTPNDGIFTLAVVFTDSTSNALEYKYAVDGVFEGLGLGNRFVGIDDQFDAVGNPQVLPTDDLNQTFPVAAPTLPRAGLSAQITDVRPSPFNPRTTVVFEVNAPGRVMVDVLDVRGRKVTTLVDREMTVGEYEVPWAGLAADGRSVASGVYFARIQRAGEAHARKMVLVK